MTSMENAIEQAARAVHAGHCCPCDLRGCYEPDPADYNAARALADAGLLAPAPLTEIRAENQFGETHRRWATDWMLVDRAEGDGSADQ